jgi:DNA-binding NarL/FixJ family response regulator
MKHALVVDDHPIMRGGVRDLLQQAFPSLAVKESSGGDGIVDEICGSDWAFVVLDISLPGGNGIEILKKAKAACPDMPIIVYSLFPEAQFAARALRAGAAAYLAKDREAHELVAAVKAAVEGTSAKATKGRTERRPMLSDREIQVLTLFGKGMSRKEIAEFLRINAKTVSTYKARLLHKLGLRNLAELVRYAAEEKLVE